MKNVINWFIKSSIDPEETSLTLLSLLGAGSGFVIENLNKLGLNITLAQYTNDIGHSVAVVGLVLAAIGFARKVFLTSNSVVTTQG